MERILIVEDDKTQLTTLTDILSRHNPGWTISEAADYDEAASLIRQSLEKQNHYSLFLLDVQLTLDVDDRGGFRLAELLRSQTPYYQTPILFLTSILDEGMTALARFHCYDYITKPYTPDSLLFQIRQLQLTGHLSQMMQIRDTNRIYHYVDRNSVLKVESMAHGLRILTDTGALLTRQYTMPQMLELLGEDFVQCHRRYIIPRKKILAVDFTTMMVTLPYETLPIGRKYTDGLSDL